MNISISHSVMTNQTTFLFEAIKMTIFMDLETLPTNNQSAIDELAANIKPPATHKKQETIDTWMAENKEQALKDMVAKTSFDGMYGRIACIGYAKDDDEVLATPHDASEGDVIQVFFDYVAIKDDWKFCGHNIAGFDLPFLKHRSIILGIKPPRQIKQAFNAKPWDDCISDTMLMWSQDREKRASMDKLCRAFGIQGKGDFNGSMVAETWPIDPAKVIEYCKDDIMRTREIYKRISAVIA